MEEYGSTCDGLYTGYMAKVCQSVILKKTNARLTASFQDNVGKPVPERFKQSRC